MKHENFNKYLKLFCWGLATGSYFIWLLKSYDTESLFDLLFGDKAALFTVWTWFMLETEWNIKV